MDPADFPKQRTALGHILSGSGLPDGDSLHDGMEVTPGQVKAMLDEQQDFVLVDCRTPQEVQFARIEGAKWIPLQDLARRHTELLGFQNSSIVIYCHHGVRSLQMAMELRQRGFLSVKSMSGGIDLWAIDIDRTVARY